MHGELDAASAATATAMDISENFWDQIKGRLAGKIGAQGFQNWIMRTSFDAIEGEVLRVSVPDQVTKEWMEQEYAEEIHKTICEMSLPVAKVVYVLKAAAASPERWRTQRVSPYSRRPSAS